MEEVISYEKLSLKVPSFSGGELTVLAPGAAGFGYRVASIEEYGTIGLLVRDVYERTHIVPWSNIAHADACLARPQKLKRAA